MKNQDNYVASLSRLGRWLAEQAEEGGRDAPARDRRRRSCSSRTAACAASAPATRVAAATASRSANFEPGSDLVASVTVLAEGTQGHLTGVALDRFGLAGENPQVWALGVKEVWKVARPLDRVIHTMGWPLRAGAHVPRVRRLVHLPDGRRHAHARHGGRARLPRRRALRSRPAAGAEDASARAEAPRRRRARRVGSEDDSGGRLRLAAEAAARAGPADRAATAPASSTCPR